MKILFYNHTGQVSGAERMLLMILSRMDRQTFEPFLVCPPEGSLTKMAFQLGVKVEPLKSLEARFTWRVDHLLLYVVSFLKAMRELRRKVKNHQPDLIHANSIRSGLVATAATIGLKPPVVWHLHDLLPPHPISSLIRLFAALSGRSVMIAVSAAVARNFRGRLSSPLNERISVILNAIDLDKFQPDHFSKRRIRKELRFREPDFVVGTVGQITPRKGQLELLRAFRVALNESPNMVLLIVGAPLFNRDHEYLDTLRSTATKLGIGNKVRLLGARNDVASIMQTLDLLVVNSKAEPFGLVIVEAMACETPVLAAAVDGIPEIIQHNENGWLVSPGDEAALAEGIVKLSRRPEHRARLANRGMQHAEAHFSADRYLVDLHAFYRSRLKKLGSQSAESTTRVTEVAEVA
ncbi:MAG TPA: glycosyltransferase family 4 protein [Pyrinomonadaceae bacterium]|nr:glycosyltransferase family 4 protein [Pyrinomonadaceae bacterium]